MDNYTITVVHKLIDYPDEDDIVDYEIRIRIFTNEEIEVYNAYFAASALNKIPDNLNGYWDLYVNTDSVNEFSINKYHSTQETESPYYVSFVTSIDSANHVSNKFTLKYTPVIDEMIVKLREILNLRKSNA